MLKADTKKAANQPLFFYSLKLRKFLEVQRSMLAGDRIPGIFPELSEILHDDRSCRIPK